MSLILPDDFIILDYESDQKVPFILKRPFLATCPTIIDVYEAKMTMRMSDQVEGFNVYRAVKFPIHYEELAIISIRENDVTTVMPYMSLTDPLNELYWGMGRK